MKDYDQVRHEGVIAVIVGILAVLALMISVAGSLFINNNSANNILNKIGTSTMVAFDANEALSDVKDNQKINFYKNNKEVCELTYEYRAEGEMHIFRFDHEMDSFEKGHYKISELNGTIEYHTKEYEDDINPTIYSITENQTLYQSLMSYIPKNYIKNNFNGDNVNKQDLFSLITVYSIDSENGKTDQRFTFLQNKPNKYIHYTTDETRLEITW